MQSSTIIKIFGAFGFSVAGLVLVFNLAVGDPVSRAVVEMGWGLIVLWVIVCGSLMLRFRDRIRIFVLRIKMSWKIKFVLFCTILAMIEEAITTTMTNMAPVFGVKVGEAYITASTNYLDVIALHSVVVFIPMFIGWAFLLSRYDFSPNAVFILFGILGATSEASFSGPSQLLGIGYWMFIYGLMVYLPAYTLPKDRNAKTPKFRHYALAIILPLLFAIPVAGIVNLIHPVKVHFESCLLASGC